jgi:hypothetical protein
MPWTSSHDAACTSTTLRIWEQKPLDNQTWINLCPFIQGAYQRCLTSGTITSTQSGYAQSNCFAGLATNEDSDINTANTIAGTINLHMANLTAQTTATLNKHATQMNTSLQQLAANNAQLHQQQQAIMNQMAMMSLGGAYQGAAAVVIPQQTIRVPPQIYLPSALPHHQQGYFTMPQVFGGYGCMAGQSGGEIDTKLKKICQQTSSYPTLYDRLLSSSALTSFICATINQRQQCYSHCIKLLHTIAMLGMRQS